MDVARNGIECRVDVADAIVWNDILDRLGIIGNIILARKDRIAASCDLATIHGSADDTYLCYAAFVPEILQVGNRIRLCPDWLGGGLKNSG